jgi:hypothetical protein
MPDRDYSVSCFDRIGCICTRTGPRDAAGRGNSAHVDAVHVRAVADRAVHADATEIDATEVDLIASDTVNVDAIPADVVTNDVIARLSFLCGGGSQQFAAIVGS